MISSFTVGSLLLGVALVLIVGLFLTRPFFRPLDEEFETDEQIESLLAQKEALLQDVRSLDNDMEAGKVAPELYAHDRPMLMKRAALVLQQLDRLGYVEAPVATTEAAAAVQASSAMSVDDQIEAAVRKLRTPAEVDADIEAAIQQMRQQGTTAPATVQPAPARVAAQPATTRYCPQCGRPVDAEDRFCAACGQNLTVEPHAAQSA